jgi:hypothetical protein
MATVGELVVNLKAETASFIQGIDKSRSAATTFGVAMGGILGTIALKFGEMAGEAARAIPELIKQSVELADSLNKASQKAGIAVEDLSALKHAAELSDVEFGDLTASLVKLNRSMDSARAGGNEQAAAFARLGVSVSGASGLLKPTSDILGELADRFAMLPDSAEKSSLAVGIFGRSGANLIPLLNQGSVGISRLTEEAKKMGLVIGDETAKRSEELNDNWKRLDEASTGLGNTLLTIAGPALSSLSSDLVDAANDASAFFSTMIAGVGALEREMPKIGSDKFKRDITDLWKQLNPGQPVSKNLFDKVLPTDWLDQWGRDGKQATEKAAAFVAELHKIGPKIISVQEAARNAARERSVNPIRSQIGTELRPLFGEQNPVTVTFFRALQSEIDAADARFEKFNADLEESVLFKSRGLLPNKGVMDNINETLLGADIGITKVGKAAKEATQGMQEFARAIGTGFEDAIVKADSLRSVLKGLADDLLRLFVRQTITGPKGILGGLFDKLGGFLGGIFGGGKASGGPVMSGAAYVVGESGPELFVPRQAGNIVSNAAIAGAGGTQVVYNIDARGAQQGVGMEIVRALQQVEDRAVMRSVATVRELQLRRA